MIDPIERLRRQAQNETTAPALNKLLHLAEDEIDLLRAERDALAREDEIKAGVNRALLAEIERLRAALIVAMEIVQRERVRIAYNSKGAPPAIEIGYADILHRLDAIIAQADAALGSER